MGKNVKLYNVYYFTSKGVKKYCLHDMPLSVAKEQLDKFKARYLLPCGKPQVYPNGKGVFDIRNPQIVRVN